jgi:curved DNA-binding protein CbpA
MSVLESNLAALVARYPEYAEDLKRYGNPESFTRFEIRETDGVLDFYEQSELLDSTREGYLKFDFPRSSSPLIVLCFGFGLGGGLHKILQGLSRIPFKIFVIEPSWERFIYSIGITELSEVFACEQIEFLIGLSRVRCFSKFYSSFQEVSSIPKMEADLIFKHPSLYERSEAYFDSVEDEWETCKKIIRLGTPDLTQSLSKLEASISNSKWMEESMGLKSLQNLHKDRQALIIGAGNSITQCLDDIRSLQNQMILIAEEEIYDFLCQQQISPHFVVAGSRLEKRSSLFLGHPKSSNSKTVLVASPDFPELYRKRFEGPQVVQLGSELYHDDFDIFLKKGKTQRAISRGAQACYLAETLGCSAIHLVGYDLCYNPQDLRLYLEGSAWEDNPSHPSLEALSSSLRNSGASSLIYLEGLNSQMLASNERCLRDLKEFSWLAGQLSASLKNLTPYGLKIPGVERLSFADLKKNSRSIPKQQDPVDSKLMKSELKWHSIREQIEILLEKLMDFKTQAESFPFKDLSTRPDLSQQLIDLLREAQSSLMGNSSFQKWILWIHLRRHLDIEGEWMRLGSSDGMEMIRLGLLRDWFSEMCAAAQQVSLILRKTGD